MRKIVTPPSPFFSAQLVQLHPLNLDLFSGVALLLLVKYSNIQELCRLHPPPHLISKSWICPWVLYASVCLASWSIQTACCLNSTCTFLFPGPQFPSTSVMAKIDRHEYCPTLTIIIIIILLIIIITKGSNWQIVGISFFLFLLKYTNFPKPLCIIMWLAGSIPPISRQNSFFGFMFFLKL